MIWQSQKPQPTGQSLEERKELITQSLLVDSNKEEIHIQGPRKSGKTYSLQNYLLSNPSTLQVLVIITWATERRKWREFLEKHNVKNVLIHTNDSLALYLINGWAKKEGKTLEWIKDHKIPTVTHERLWLDSSSYARSLLSKNKITIGIAHWLLQNEIESFINKSMVPRPDLLLLDNPDQWEQEAQFWTRQLPFTKKLTTHLTYNSNSHYRPHKKAKDYITLKGWVSQSGEVYDHRWIELQEEEPTTWKGYTLITQHTDKMEKWICKKRGIPMRTIEQTRGRSYEKVWLESLPTHKLEKDFWGDKTKTLEKLDIVASSASKSCFTHVEHWDNTSLIPNPPKTLKTNFLTWDV